MCTLNRTYRKLQTLQKLCLAGLQHKRSRFTCKQVHGTRSSFYPAHSLVYSLQWIKARAEQRG